MPWNVIADGGAWYVVDGDGVSTGTMHLHEDDAAEDAFAQNRVGLFATVVLDLLRELRNGVYLPGSTEEKLERLLDVIEGRTNAGMKA